MKGRENIGLQLERFGEGENTRGRDLHRIVVVVVVVCSNSARRPLRAHRATQLLRGREYCRRGMLLARTANVCCRSPSFRCTAGGTRVDRSRRISPVSIVTILALTRRVLPRCYNHADGYSDKKCIAAAIAPRYFELFSRLLKDGRSPVDFNKLKDHRDGPAYICVCVCLFVCMELLLRF